MCYLKGASAYAQIKQKLLKNKPLKLANPSHKQQKIHINPFIPLVKLANSPQKQIKVYQI
jgi:hypothetical protein